MEAQKKSHKSGARSLLAIVLCALLTIGAGVFPLVYFHLSDEARLRAIHPRANPSAALSPQAGDIYLVRAIRALYSEDSPSPLDSEAAEALFPGAYRELVESAAFPPGYDALLPAQAVYHVSIEGYQNMVLQHYAVTAPLPTAEDPFLSFQAEEKTGKLIFLGIGKKGLKEALSLPDRQALMDGYLRYLGLDILGDWKENEIGRMSAKAQLQLYCLMNEDALLLCAAPIGFFDNNRLPDLLSSLFTWSELIPSS